MGNVTVNAAANYIFFLLVIRLSRINLTFKLGYVTKITLTMDNAVCAKVATIILGHGSRSRGADTAIKRIAMEIGKIGCYATVQYAFLQFIPPTPAEVLEKCVQQKVDKIIIVPFFLQRGTHVMRDIPDIIKDAKKRYPSIEFVVTEIIGSHHKLAQLVRDLINEKI